MRWLTRRAGEPSVPKRWPGSWQYLACNTAPGKCVRYWPLTTVEHAGASPFTSCCGLRTTAVQLSFYLLSEPRRENESAATFNAGYHRRSPGHSEQSGPAARVHILGQRGASSWLHISSRSTSRTGDLVARCAEPCPGSAPPVSEERTPDPHISTPLVTLCTALPHTVGLQRCSLGSLATASPVSAELESAQSLRRLLHTLVTTAPIVWAPCTPWPLTQRPSLKASEMVCRYCTAQRS